jgi:hypothetical protein
MPAGAELAHRLEGAHHGEIAARVVARLDGPAVDEDRRDVHPGDRDHRAGHVLVAAADRDQTPSMLCAPQAVSIEVGDHLPGDEGVLHPSVPIEIPSLTVMVPKSWGIAAAGPNRPASGPAGQDVEPGIAGVMVL